MKEIYPSLWVFEKTFQKSEDVYKSIESFIDTNISFNWQWAKTEKSSYDDNLQNAYRTNQIFSISSNRDIEEINIIDDLIFKNTTEHIGQYSHNYQLGTLNDEGYAILKYENGTMYKQHHDCGGIHSNRVVSMLVYLNDDYEGGELEFPYLGIKYNPVAGDIVLFPSNYTFSHIAHPVTKGTKYAIVSWLSYAGT